jgi:threonine/homoserine/homoserine lactone efflux protein
MPVDPGLLLGFVTLSAVLSAVPGPSVILATSRAITRGRAAALWIVLGNALGGLWLLVLVVAGLGALVAASATVFLVVKVLGAAYLFWLGLRAIRSARSAAADPLDGDEEAGAETRSRHPRRRALRQGFLVGASNPKSIVSLVAVLPQFVATASSTPVALQMLLIGLGGGVVQVSIETTWVCAAGGLRSWFRRRPRRIRTVKATGGVAMIGLAGKLALEGRAA